MSQIDFIAVLNVVNFTDFFSEESIFKSPQKLGNSLTKLVNKQVDLSQYYSMDRIKIKELTDVIYHFLIANKKMDLINSDRNGIKNYLCLRMFKEMPLEALENDVFDFVVFYRNRLENRKENFETSGRLKKYGHINEIQSTILSLYQGIKNNSIDDRTALKLLQKAVNQIDTLPPEGQKRMLGESWQDQKEISKH